jgi:hypothetical protein
LCWELGVVNSAIQTIWNNRTKIIIAYEQKESRIKVFRKPERSDVDEWFKQERRYSVPMSGPLLMIIFVLPKF